MVIVEIILQGTPSRSTSCQVDVMRWPNPGLGHVVEYENWTAQPDKRMESAVPRQADVLMSPPSKKKHMKIIVTIHYEAKKCQRFH
jgi:hypothetical protein